ncbi:MAG: hypothetical protein ACREN7_10325, partial [Candidatus Dormibacteria bacterium]
PRLGFSSDAVLLSWSAYSGSSFSGTLTWALNPTQMATGAALAGAAYAQSNSAGPQLAISPATSASPTATAWAAYTDQLAAPDDLLGVISFSGAPSSSNFHFLEQDLAISTLSSPPAAQQPDSSAPLAVGDNRVLAASWSDGTLWLSANDGCRPSSDSTVRACVRLISVGTATSTDQVRQDFDIGVSGQYLFDPALALDNSGNLYLGLEDSSSARDPSATALMLPSTELTPGTVPTSPGLLTVQGGSASYHPDCSSTCQTNAAYDWGTGSGAAVDPTSPMEVWVASEYAASQPASGCPTPSSTAGDSGCWSTAIGELGVPSRYSPVPPARILDTRAGSGEPGAGQTLRRGSTISVQVAGEGGVPAQGVSAVALNVTVTDTTEPSYLTAFPAGAPLPLASNLNWNGDTTIANLVVVSLGDGGQVDFFNAQGSADLVVDAEGYFTPYGGADASAYVPLTPVRITDTRSGSGEPNSGRTLGPASSLAIQVTGASGVATSSVTAALLNVTVTDATAPSYLTVFRAGGSPPLASNLNWL